MKRIQWLLVTALGLGLAANAAGQHPGPYGHPELQNVSEVQPAQDLVILTVHITVPKAVPVQIEKEVIGANGVPMKVTETTYKTEYVMTTQNWKWSAKDKLALDKNGKALSKAKLFERLQKGTVVLVLPKDHKLEPAYRRILSNDAVVLTDDPIPHKEQ